MIARSLLRLWIFFVHALAFVLLYLFFSKDSEVRSSQGEMNELLSPQSDSSSSPPAKPPALSPYPTAPTAEDVFTNVIVPLLGRDGKVTPSAKVIFKLSDAEVAELEGASGIALQEIKRLERKNAVIQTQNNLGALIRISNFGDQAASAKQEYQRALQKILGEERAATWIAASAVPWKSVFSNFGTFQYMTVKLIFTGDGGNDIEVTTQPIGPGPLQGERISGRVPDRLSHLIEVQTSSTSQ